MKAVDPIVPDDSQKTKEKAINKIQDTRRRLTDLIDIHDPSKNYF
jgi:hypothetical protein